MSFHDILAEWSRWGWPLIANHLWQATLVALFALAAARLLKRGAARARYIIWLIASLKFAVPSVLIVFLMNQAGIEFPSLVDQATSPGSVTVIHKVAAPVAQQAEPIVTSAGSAREHNEIYCAMTAAWFTGAAFLLALWWRRRHQFSIAIRAGEVMSAGREIETLNRVRAWLAIKRPVKLVITPTLLEPGVWRAWRPVVVLPCEMPDHLTDAELEAVMMHEMIHITRYDNLTNSIQMFFCCLLWFHPIVWLIDRRLLAEREQSCDEQVIEISGAAQVYASSLLKVFRFCLGSKVAGVSYATGSNLRRRVEQIMAENTDRRFALSHKILVVATAAMVIVFSLAAGLFNRSGLAAQSERGNTILPGGPTGGVSGGVTGGIPGGVIGGVPGGVSGGIPGGVPGGVPGGIPGGVEVGSQDQPPPPPPKMTDAIIEQLEQAPELTAQFTNRAETPLAITSVKIKTIEVKGSSSGGGEASNYYPVKVIISMVNSTNQHIKSIKLQLTNRETNYVFISSFRRLRIEPHSTYTLGKSAREFMFYTRQLGSPESLTAEIVGVRFEDGSGWGDVSELTPPPPPPPPHAESADVAPVAPPDAGEPPMAPPASSSDALDGSKIIRKAGGVLQDSAVKRVEPEYSPLAKAAQVSGAVTVEIIVSEEGVVTSARAVSGHPLLRAAAVEAARQWQFKPTTLSGEPVRVTGTLTFFFQL